MPDTDTYKHDKPPVRWRLGTYAFLITALAGAIGYLGWEYRTRAKALQTSGSACAQELAEKGTALASASQRADGCDTELTALKTKLPAAEASLGEMEKNLSATRGELEELRKWRTETAKRIQTFRDMSAKLQKMVDTGKLGIRVRDGRLVMRLPENVLFPSGSAQLSREGELAIMEVAVILRQFPDRRFMIAGHTDDQPVKSEQYRDNWELSIGRALVVTHFLVEAKLKPQNLVPAGYAEFDPIASNKTAEGRKENRRIEIVMLPDLSELPTLPEDLADATKPAEAKPAAEPKPADAKPAGAEAPAVEPTKP